ncbi:MAG: huwentoxin-IV family protein [Chloroflexota bacterium]
MDTLRDGLNLNSGDVNLVIHQSPPVSVHSSKSTRRRFVKGTIAAVVGIEAAAYMKPSMQAFGVPAVHAQLSGHGGMGCGQPADLCMTDSDCCSGLSCVDDANAGQRICVLISG